MVFIVKPGFLGADFFSERKRVGVSSTRNAAIEQGTHIAIRQVKYLNNVVEQDQRGVKRITRSMLGFKAFDAAQATLVGIELMHMIKKRQMVVRPETRAALRLNCSTPWLPHPCHRQGQLPLHDLLRKICDKTGRGVLTPDRTARPY